MGLLSTLGRPAGFDAERLAGAVMDGRVGGGGAVDGGPAVVGLVEGSLLDRGSGLGGRGGQEINGESGHGVLLLGLG